MKNNQNPRPNHQTIIFSINKEIGKLRKTLTEVTIEKIDSSCVTDRVAAINAFLEHLQITKVPEKNIEKVCSGIEGCLKKLKKLLGRTYIRSYCDVEYVARKTTENLRKRLK